MLETIQRYAAGSIERIRESELFFLIVLFALVFTLGAVLSLAL